jgi:hypothetical protein
MHKDSILSYITGLAGGIYGAIVTAEWFRTCMFAMLGAVVGFATTELLHYLKKGYLEWRKTKKANGKSKR